MMILFFFTRKSSWGRPWGSESIRGSRSWTRRRRRPSWCLRHGMRCCATTESRKEMSACANACDFYFSPENLVRICFLEAYLLQWAEAAIELAHLRCLSSSLSLPHSPCIRTAHANPSVVKQRGILIGCFIGKFLFSKHAIEQANWTCFSTGL